MKDAELLTANELAQRLRLKSEMVRSWARDGTIPSYRLGHKTIRFDPVEVIEALRVRRSGGEV